MEKQLPGAGFGRKYGEYYTMVDDAFCGVPGVDSYLQKDEREEGLCTGKRTAQNRSSRQCT